MSEFNLYDISPKHFQSHPEDAGRNKSNGNQARQLKSMWERHHVMKRLSVLGWTAKEIADHLGMTPESVRSCLNSEIMRREVDILRAGMDAKTLDVAKRLENMANKSCDILDEILEDDNAPIAIRSKVALSILDRTGYPAHTKVTGTIDHRHLTVNEIEEVKLRALMLKEDIVDVEYTTSE